MATITIPDDLAAELEQTARQQHMSLAEVVQLKLSQPTPDYVMPSEEEATEEFYEASMELWNQDD